MSQQKLRQFELQLQLRKQQQLLRQPPVLDEYRGSVIRIAGKNYSNFSGNDYLGLSTDASVLKAYADGVMQYGAGSSGSPMVTGHHYVHQQLTDSLCDWLGYDKALLFSSGFAANQAMLHTLATEQDTLLLDKLCHASLIDAARYGPAKFKRFAHNDVHALSRLLQSDGDKVVVTEGVFSMDGDSPDLSAMLRLSQQHQAPLMLDDAHGLGVLGDEGRGSLAAQGIAVNEVFCTMANFGKALGLGGAFIGASNTVIDYLSQFGRHYIYSTALSPALCAAVIKSIELCRKDNWRREKLQQNIALFRDLAADLPLLDSATAIQAVILGSEERTLGISAALKQAGIWLTAIRPPTVPPGSSRLRITMSAQHSEQDIRTLVQQLRKLI